jgi:hypothetical protein
MSNPREIDVTVEVKQLVEKAAKASDSADAMRFSQAAVNAANAMIGLRQLEKD